MYMYLAYNEQIKVGTNMNNKGCLQVDNDKVAIKPCDVQNDKQKFSYMIDGHNGNKTYFTADNQCLEIKEPNFITTVPCSSKKTNWKWTKNKQIQKSNVPYYCLNTNNNNELIVGDCGKKNTFDMQFTSYGQLYCKNNFVEPGCGTYGKYNPGGESIIYGSSPNMAQVSTNFLLDCSDTNINKITIDETGNIGVKCRGSDDTNYAIPDTISDNLKNRYYKDNIRVFKTNYGFSGVLVGANSQYFKTFYPYARDNPLPSGNMIEYQSYFDCPTNQVLTQIYGTYDVGDSGYNIKGVKFMCDDINKQFTTGYSDLFYGNLLINLLSSYGTDVSHILHYFEINNIEQINSINTKIGIAKPNSDYLVLIKMIPDKIRIMDIPRLTLSKAECANDTEQFGKKTQNFNHIVEGIQMTLKQFDRSMQSVRVDNQKNIMTIPNLLPIAKSEKNLYGYCITLINSSNVTVRLDHIIKNIIETEKPIYIIVYNSNVCCDYDVSDHMWQSGNSWIPWNPQIPNQSGEREIQWRVIERFGINDDVNPFNKTIVQQEQQEESNNVFNIGLFILILILTVYIMLRSTTLQFKCS
jgi:hypothetical protein